MQVSCQSICQNHLHRCLSLSSPLVHASQIVNLNAADVRKTNCHALRHVDVENYARTSQGIQKILILMSVMMGLTLLIVIVMNVT